MVLFEQLRVLQVYDLYKSNNSSNNKKKVKSIN